MLLTLRYYLKDKSGQGIVEYSIIISLIAICVMGAVAVFGDKLLALLNYIVESIDY